MLGENKYILGLLTPNRPVDGRVPCDRSNRAPEFERPPILCSPVAWRRSAQAHQAEILADRDLSWCHAFRNASLRDRSPPPACSFASPAPVPRRSTDRFFPLAFSVPRSPPPRLFARRRPVYRTESPNRHSDSESQPQSDQAPAPKFTHGTTKLVKVVRNFKLINFAEKTANLPETLLIY
jgi:hypothetical protein